MKPGKIFSVGALSLAIFTTSLMPAEAVTMPSAKAQISAVEQVQWRRDRRGWYHGHRGYREHRPGYRRHRDGLWYPLAAFGAGAIIGGAMTAPPRAYRTGDRHIRWCTERYRTYRASDNTYVVRAGVRAQCYSPYD